MAYSLEISHDMHSKSEDCEIETTCAPQLVDALLKFPSFRATTATSEAAFSLVGDARVERSILFLIAGVQFFVFLRFFISDYWCVLYGFSGIKTEELVVKLPHVKLNSLGVFFYVQLSWGFDCIGFERFFIQEWKVSRISRHVFVFGKFSGPRGKNGDGYVKIRGGC